MRRRAGNMRERASISMARLVAVREVTQRLKTRAFQIGSVLTLAIVVGGSLFAGMHQHQSQTVKVEIAGGGFLPALVQKDAALSGVTVVKVGYQGSQAAKKALQSGEVDLVVFSDHLLTENPLSPFDGSALGRFAGLMSDSLGALRTYSSLRLTQEEIAGLSHIAPVPIESVLTPSTHKSSTGLSIFGEIIMFTLISQYGAWVLIGVIEEKSTRVVEVLLINLKPSELLIGKVVGIGIVALAQGFLLLGSALAIFYFTGSSFLKGSSLGFLLLLGVWFMAGYSVYCVAFAVAGSLVSRQEDAQSVGLVVQLPMFLGYVLSFSALNSSSVSSLVKGLSFVPGLSSFLMPALFASGHATAVDQVVGLAISVLGVLVLAKVGARIYSGAILATGGRIKIRSALSQARW